MKSFITIILLLLCTTTVSAQNTGGVFGPGVNEGHKSFQYRAALDPDNSANETGFAHRLHYQQAINDDFMWRILGQARKTDDSDSDFDFVQAELFWQLQESDNYLSGVRFDLRYRDAGRPSQVGFNWMHEYNLKNNWRSRLLLLTSIEFGSGAADGISLQTRGSIWKKTTIGNIGLELFNSYGTTKDFRDFDDQSHTIGPFISRPLGKSGWSLFSGALFGITDASTDADFRIWLTKTL